MADVLSGITRILPWLILIILLLAIIGTMIVRQMG